MQKANGKAIQSRQSKQFAPSFPRHIPTGVGPRPENSQRGQNNHTVAGFNRMRRSQEGLIDARAASSSPERAPPHF